MNERQREGKPWLRARRQRPAGTQPASRANDLMSQTGPGAHTRHAPEHGQQRTARQVNADTNAHRTHSQESAQIPGFCSRRIVASICAKYCLITAFSASCGRMLRNSDHNKGQMSSRDHDQADTRSQTVKGACRSEPGRNETAQQQASFGTRSEAPPQQPGPRAPRRIIQVH